MDITIITGRLTADPVRRATQNGKELADFTVAVDRGRGDAKKTAFFRCTAWEGKAAPILQYLHKGDLVGVSGTVSATAFTGRDGQTKASLEINVIQCDFLHTKKPDAPQEETFTKVEDQDLPF